MYLETQACSLVFASGHSQHEWVWGPKGRAETWARMGETCRVKGERVSRCSVLPPTGQTAGAFNLEFHPLALPGRTGMRSKDDPVSTKERFRSKVLTANSLLLRQPLLFAFSRWYLQRRLYQKRLLQSNPPWLNRASRHPKFQRILEARNPEWFLVSYLR